MMACNSIQKYLFIFGLLVFCVGLVAHAQTEAPIWTPVKGPFERVNKPIFGEVGVPRAANRPGGRSDSAFWTGPDGRFWMYGGEGRDVGLTADMWTFDPATQLWTAIVARSGVDALGHFDEVGVPSSNNTPGHLIASSQWTDSAGELWLFGGSVVNELWRFDRTLGQWAIERHDPDHIYIPEYGQQGVADAANTPSGRSYGASWTDSDGNFWLFGGHGSNGFRVVGLFCDMWIYNPATGFWTWTGGPQGLDHEGAYGTLGVPDAANHPGSRRNAATWTDSDGNFWLYGGFGYGAGSTQGQLCDLWKFTPATREWTYVHGPNGIDTGAEYGTQGVEDVANHPSSRQDAVTWTDADGMLWLYGGRGFHGAMTLIYGLGSDIWRYNPATNAWAWMDGPDTVDERPVHGERGVSAGVNTPGARMLSSAWKDAAGRLWIYGGVNLQNDNWGDMWRYDPGTGDWTWMTGPDQSDAAFDYGVQGVETRFNRPRPREYAVAWADSGQRLWMFGGGFGTHSWLNDLWRYDPQSGNWTWIKGLPNQNQPSVFGVIGTESEAVAPCSRFGATGWTGADGNFWMFGGQGVTQDNAQIKIAFPNSIWKFNPATHNWTAVKVQSMPDDGRAGTYGTQGVAAVGNFPGGRLHAGAWQGGDGKLWLFGGYGFDANGQLGRLNDIWTFDPGSGFWTWVDGSDEVNSSGVYGSRGQNDAANTPGARHAPVMWTASDGSFWMFGGYGLDSAGALDGLNDLWRYDPASGDWTWMNGSATSGAPGHFGILGMPDADAMPGARSDAYAWADVKGNLWLFGGNGVDSLGYVGELNDLWKYDPNLGMWAWAGGSQFWLRPAQVDIIGLASDQSVPGARARGVSWTDGEGRFYLSGADVVDLNGERRQFVDLWQLNIVEIRSAVRSWRRYP